MSKFTYAERATIKSIVATLSIKRIPEAEILREIERQTDKIVSRRFLANVKQQIKKESSNGIHSSGKVSMSIFLSSKDGLMK